MAVPRGVHRSLVNRYGPRTPAIVAKPSNLDANGGYTAVATSASSRAAAYNTVGRGASDLALVGSSRPLLELVSCTACKALDEELAKGKGAEQTEVRARRMCVVSSVVCVPTRVECKLLQGGAKDTASCTVVGVIAWI